MDYSTGKGDRNISKLKNACGHDIREQIDLPHLAYFGLYSLHYVFHHTFLAVAGYFDFHMYVTMTL